VQSSTAEKQNVDISQRIRNAVAAFRKTKNELGSDPNAFFKYGKSRMPSTWTTPDITDEDFYTGIGYAVINKRANRSVVLGKNFLFTSAKDEIQKAANDKGTQIEHPYLTLIRNSMDFAERDFWYDISTYLDLEGIYYLMAVRSVTPTGKVGNIQKFTLLNPYWVKPVTNRRGELGGYAESNPIYGNRIIPKELIIPIKLLNPFDPSKAYSLADAARDSQFTLKQANNFARESINGNLNAPGILSSAIELPDDQFDNFVSHLKNHGHGEPFFGNGAGTVTWVDMQTDLDKAALDKINSINRDALLAISGLSKTGIGVEESGTGREVSRTQKDDFTENAVMPQIENIIDALNLDYRRYYNDQYTKNKYVISLDNPLETDRDAEQADVEIRDSQFTLMQSLVAKGYDIEIASKFAKGLVSITDLGEPTNEPVIDLTPTGDGTTPNTPDPNAPPADATPPANNYKDKTFEVYEGYPIPVIQYLDDLASQIIPLSEKGSFIYSTENDKKIVIDHLEEADNALIGVCGEQTFVHLAQFKKNADRTAILAKLNKRYKNQIVAVKSKVDFHTHEIPEVIKNSLQSSNMNDMLTSAQAAEDKLYEWYVQQIGAGISNPHPSDNQEFINSLTLPFAVYFTVMFSTYASERIKQTANELDIKDTVPVTALTDDVKKRIDEFASREAKSHIQTLQKDLENALEVIHAKTTDPTEVKQLFAVVYTQIRANRSQVIADSASSKIFHLSQYEADLQFLTRAGLLKQAYKELFSLTGDPCAFCASLIASSKSDPIPFTDAFAAFGSSLEADGKVMHFNYEDIIAGNVHPNCHCAYKIIIKE
jgi:hypothetical protein